MKIICFRRVVNVLILLLKYKLYIDIFYVFNFKLNRQLLCVGSIKLKPRLFIRLFLWVYLRLNSRTRTLNMNKSHKASNVRASSTRSIELSSAFKIIIANKSTILLTSDRYLYDVQVLQCN